MTPALIVISFTLYAIVRLTFMKKKDWIDYTVLFIAIIVLFFIGIAIGKEVYCA